MNLTLVLDLLQTIVPEYHPAEHDSARKILNRTETIG